MCWGGRNWGQGDQATTLTYQMINQIAAHPSRAFLIWVLLHSALSEALTHPSALLNVTCGHEVSEVLLS